MMYQLHHSTIDELFVFSRYKNGLIKKNKKLSAILLSRVTQVYSTQEEEKLAEQSLSRKSAQIVCILSF